MGLMYQSMEHVCIHEWIFCNGWIDFKRRFSCYSLLILLYKGPKIAEYKAHWVMNFRLINPWGLHRPFWSSMQNLIIHNYYVFIKVYKQVYCSSLLRLTLQLTLNTMASYHVCNIEPMECCGFELITYSATPLPSNSALSADCCYVWLTPHSRCPSLVSSWANSTYQIWVSPGSHYCWIRGMVTMHAKYN